MSSEMRDATDVPSLWCGRRRVSDTGRGGIAQPFVGWRFSTPPSVPNTIMLSVLRHCRTWLSSGPIAARGRKVYSPLLRRAAGILVALLCLNVTMAQAQTGCVENPTLRTFVVVDHSSTVRHRHQLVAIRHLVSSIFSLLRPQDELSILGLPGPGGDTLTFRQRFVKPAGRADSRDVQARIGRMLDRMLTLETTTPSDFDVLFQRLQDEELRPCGDVIVLVTDGSVVPHRVDGGRPTAEAAIAGVLRAAGAVRSRQVPIFAVGVDADRTSALEIGDGVYARRDSIRIADDSLPTGESVLKQIAGGDRYRSLRWLSINRHLLDWFVGTPTALVPTARRLRPLGRAFSPAALAEWNVEELRLFVDGNTLGADSPGMFARVCQSGASSGLGPRGTIAITPAPDEQLELGGCLITITHPATAALQLVRDSGESLGRLVRLGKEMRIDQLPERVWSAGASEIVLRVAPTSDTDECDISKVALLRQRDWDRRRGNSSIHVNVVTRERGSYRVLDLYSIDSTGCYVNLHPAEPSALLLGTHTYQFVSNSAGELTDTVQKHVTVLSAPPIVRATVLRSPAAGVGSLHLVASVALHDATAVRDSVRMWLAGQRLAPRVEANAADCTALRTDSVPQEVRRRYHLCFSVDTVIYGFGMEPLFVVAAAGDSGRVHSVGWYGRDRGIVCSMCVRSGLAEWGMLGVVLAVGVFGTALLRHAFRFALQHLPASKRLVRWGPPWMSRSGEPWPPRGMLFESDLDKHRARSVQGKTPASAQPALDHPISKPPENHHMFRWWVSDAALSVTVAYPLLTSFCYLDVTPPLWSLVLVLFGQLAGAGALLLPVIAWLAAPGLTAIRGSRASAVSTGSGTSHAPADGPWRPWRTWCWAVFGLGLYAGLAWLTSQLAWIPWVGELPSHPQVASVLAQTSSFVWPVAVWYLWRHSAGAHGAHPDRHASQLESSVETSVPGGANIAPAR